MPRIAVAKGGTPVPRPKLSDYRYNYVMRQSFSL